MNTDSKRESLILEILEVIEGQNDVTQRHLADRLGVALGLTNSYLKRCIRKGFIKVQQAPANRYLYYLTPKGFAEKSRLTVSFLSSSFDTYRTASRDYANVMRKCREQDLRRVIFCGYSELAEIASLRAKERGIEIMGVYEPDSNEVDFLGLPVWRNAHELPLADVSILTALNNPGLLYQQVKENFKKLDCIVPDFLSHISDNGTQGDK